MTAQTEFLPGTDVPEKIENLHRPPNAAADFRQDAPILLPPKSAAVSFFPEGPDALRVAAYIRVSTTSETQEASFESQSRYFSRKIRETPGWVLAGIYADQGISGTSGSRAGFTRLLRHCREGRIQRILCKSVSRFARNTADFLLALETLRHCGVTILFEKEGLDTAGSSGEFLLTLFGALAQEESRSLSGNLTLGNRMRYQRGQVRNAAVYGYRLSTRMVTGENGWQYPAVEIVEAEAAVVRRIFQMTVQGVPYAQIARQLNREGIPPPDSPANRKRRQKARAGQLRSHLEEGWTGTKISALIRSERYVGDVLAQKTYTADYLTHQVRRNRGELPQYRIENHHPAIIDRALFDAAQLEADRRGAPRARSGKRTVHSFSSRILCGCCGRFYHLRPGKTGSRWVCPTAERKSGQPLCHGPPLPEAALNTALCQAAERRFCLWTPPALAGLTVTDILGGSFDIPEPRDLPRQMAELLTAVLNWDPALHDPAAEEYRQALERDFPLREAALLWLASLPPGRAGAAAFFEGLRGTYCGAFLISVTVQPGGGLIFRWFDDTRTQLPCPSAGPRQSPDGH